MKKYVLGIFTLVLVISFSAFTDTNLKTPGKQHSITRYWVNDGTCFVEYEGVPSTGFCILTSTEKCIIKAEDQPEIPSSFLLGDRSRYATQNVCEHNGVYYED